MKVESAPGLVVVSGLPRSGTSLVMQMLRAGGWPLFVDDKRAADPSNPNGYFEHHLTKEVWHDRSWFEQARGRAVKIVAPNVRALAWDPFSLLGLEPVKVLLVMRPLPAVMESQRRMMQRLGRPLLEKDETALRAALSEVLNKTLMDLENASHMELLLLTHGRLLSHADEEAQRIANFLGPLPESSLTPGPSGRIPAAEASPDVAAMAAAVDPGLNRTDGAG